jgi:hypothetical protein
LKTASYIYNGSFPRDVRKFAFENAVALKKNIPEVWKDKEISGPKWFTNFLKRHKTFLCANLRQQPLVKLPVSTTLTLMLCFDNLKALLDHLLVGSGDIWKMDETGITTVQTRDRVLAVRGCNQIGRQVSAEHGNLVTLALAVSATGNTVPSFFVISKVNSPAHFLNGDVNPTGGMKAEHFFLNFVNHFVSRVKPSK